MWQLLEGKEVDQAFWLMEVVEVNLCKLEEEECTGDYGRVLPKGLQHLSGHFLRKNEKYSSTKKTVYSKSTKITYFFIESILFPYVNMVEENSLWMLP